LDLLACQGKYIKRIEPIGLLKVKICGARGIQNAESFGKKSDPYAKFHYHRRLQGATHVKDNSLDPLWNETFFSICYSKSELITIEIWDYNNLKKDRTLGKVEFFVGELLDPNPILDGDEIIQEMNDLDLRRGSWLARNKRDGLKINRLSPTCIGV
jgi:Ca2+-dependent lipid-binding protein